MAEDIKALIDKINEEGVKAGQEKAAAIEEEARKRAQGLVEKALKESEKLVIDAKERIARMEEKQKALLSQAGRDLLLSLRKEINSMLHRIIVQDLHQALSATEMARIIFEMVTQEDAQHKGDILITLGKEHREALEKSVLAKLKDRVTHQITLQPSDQIHAGFMISFDGGKSQFDFTDKALAEYIGTYLKPKLNELLKGAVEA